MIDIIFQYFQVKADPKLNVSKEDAKKRQAEYDECLYRNLTHKYVQGVHILLESNDDCDCLEKTLQRLSTWLSPEEQSKITAHLLGRQMLYSDAFQYANDQLVKKERERERGGGQRQPSSSSSSSSIVVIMNADIIIGPGVELLLSPTPESESDNKTFNPKRYFKNTVFSLTRHEHKLCLHQKQKNNNKNDYYSNNNTNNNDNSNNNDNDNNKNNNASTENHPALSQQPQQQQHQQPQQEQQYQHHHCNCPLIPSLTSDKPNAYTGSHDSFWFVPPITPHFIKCVQHVQNQWGSEHVVIKELLAHGYKVINPSRSILTFHNHASAIRPWNNENNNNYGDDHNDNNDNNNNSIQVNDSNDNNKNDSKRSIKKRRSKPKKKPLADPRDHLPLYPIYLSETYPWWPPGI